jgi:hypothetical protein
MRYVQYLMLSFCGMVFLGWLLKILLPAAQPPAISLAQAVQTRQVMHSQMQDTVATAVVSTLTALPTRLLNPTPWNTTAPTATVTPLLLPVRQTPVIIDLQIFQATISAWEINKPLASATAPAAKLAAQVTNTSIAPRLVSSLQPTLQRALQAIDLLAQQLEQANQKKLLACDKFLIGYTELQLISTQPQPIAVQTAVRQILTTVDAIQQQCQQANLAPNGTQKTVPSATIRQAMQIIRTAQATLAADAP